MTDKHFSIELRETELLLTLIKALAACNGVERHASQRDGAYGSVYEAVERAVATIGGSASLATWVMREWCISGDDVADMRHLVDRINEAVVYGLHTPHLSVRNALRETWAGSRGVLFGDKNLDAVDAYVQAIANKVCESFGDRIDFSIVWDETKTFVTLDPNA